jgi:hypothetical protein
VNRLLAVALLFPALSAAVELQIQFGALERLLTQQVFTQEGRRYVKGAKSNKCNFAYLEKPQIRGEGGRLRMQARFTGRSALNFAGQCVGLGDAFDVVVLALPVYRKGALALQDVKVTSPAKSGYYIRKVCEAMQATLVKDFQYPLDKEAREILESAGGPTGYKRELRNFTISSIGVSSDALVLQLDFQLTVK